MLQGIQGDGAQITWIDSDEFVGFILSLNLCGTNFSKIGANMAVLLLFEYSSIIKLPGVLLGIWTCFAFWLIYYEAQTRRHKPEERWNIPSSDSKIRKNSKFTPLNL